VVPKAHTIKSTARIMDLQDPTSKMSKSGHPAGIIELLDEPKVIAKRIKSAVTDSGTEITWDPEGKPGVANLLSIYSAFADKPVEQVVQDYQGKMYGHLKVDLADLVVPALEPFRAKTKLYLDDPAQLDRLLAEGAARAVAIASQVYARIATRFGVEPGLAGAPADGGGQA
jgi:tryptophanyl-tRNA synthetase